MKWWPIVVWPIGRWCSKRELRALLDRERRVNKQIVERNYSRVIDLQTQLIEAQEKILNPKIGVRTATEVQDAVLGDWLYKGRRLIGAQAKKYQRIVQRFHVTPLIPVGKHEVEALAFTQAVFEILGDDVKPTEPDDLQTKYDLRIAEKASTKKYDGILRSLHSYQITLENVESCSATTLRLFMRSILEKIGDDVDVESRDNGLMGG